jgi:hypothetical protein
LLFWYEIAFFRNNMMIWNGDHVMWNRCSNKNGTLFLQIVLDDVGEFYILWGWNIGLKNLLRSRYKIHEFSHLSAFISIQRIEIECTILQHWPSFSFGENCFEFFGDSNQDALLLMIICRSFDVWLMWWILNIFGIVGRLICGSRDRVDFYKMFR